jgi:hypothetical protein
LKMCGRWKMRRRRRRRRMGGMASVRDAGCAGDAGGGGAGREVAAQEEAVEAEVKKNKDRS